MSYLTAEIPFQQMGNRQVLTAEQVVDEPQLMDFIKQWKHCFEHDPLRDVYIFERKAA